MRTLITGLNGFTGRYLQPELENNGSQVIGLSVDLTEQAAVAAEIAQLRPEAVIHLAGIAHANNVNANTIYKVNLIGTRNLLEALADHAPDVKSILLASSANVYGNCSKGALSENHMPDPCNDYAVSKYAMEQMARLWVKRLPIFITRPFNYTGIGQEESFIIPKIIKHFAKKSLTIKLGNIDIWREFADVRTVVEIYRKLLKLCPVGQTINICTGKSYSLREVINLCENITGHYIEIQKNEKFVRKNEVHTLTGNNGHLKSLITSWTTRNLEDTLAWMLGEAAA